MALHPLDVDHFHVDPKICNKKDVDNHTENRHGIDGYLDDQKVVTEIVQAVKKNI